MRDIKYRWFGCIDGEDTSRMHDVVGIHWGADVVELDDDYGSTYAIGDTLVQYTGLRDKTGREIYEGDIVEPLNLSSEWIGVVQYKAPAFWVYEVAGEDSGELTVWSATIALKVIGNIHKHPHFLPS